MSELAFNVNGEPFEIPAAATGWRVKKLRAKGAPEVVYGRDGMPLVLSIDADLDDLRRDAGSSGRYRLDPVDETAKAIPNGTPGYVYLHPHDREERNAETPVAAASALPAASDSIVIEAMRMNAEIAKSVVDRFPLMLEAASTLLRAADGAGLPARMSRVIDVDSAQGDDEDTDDTAASREPAGFDLNAIVAQLVPMIVTSLMNGKLKLPGLGEMFDWRKAKPAIEATGSSDVVPSSASSKSTPTRKRKTLAEAGFPTIDPTTLAHFIAIQSALQPEEAALAREVAADLGPTELRAWFDELSPLSVPDAVQKIRTMIATGGAS